MSYSKSLKEIIIEDYQKGIDNLGEYLKDKGIAKTTFYKWTKEYRTPAATFIDVTDISNVTNNTLKLTINNINIIIEDNYNESLLLILVIV